MEWLEKQAIATAPVERKPKFWKRYVDDVLELIKKDHVRNLTDTLTPLIPLATSSSPTKKRRTSRSYFWTRLLVRREDGLVKLLVYRKKSHTDQYLNFSSHHPLNHSCNQNDIVEMLQHCDGRG